MAQDRDYGGPLSSWIKVDRAKECPLADVLPRLQDDFSKRLFSIVSHMCARIARMVGRTKDIKFSQTKSYDGVRAWVYRPNWIHIAANDQAFQDEYLFVACDQPQDHSAGHEFVRDLMHNLQTDDFLYKAKSCRALRTSDQICHGELRGYAGSAQMWSLNAEHAHPINVEVFFWAMPNTGRFTASMKPSEQLPGETEWTVRLELGGRKNCGYTVLKQDANDMYPTFN